MKNMFEANIILCEQMEKGTPKGIFNNIEIKKGDGASFDVGIFFTADIITCGKEMFLVNIVYQDEMTDKAPTNILGSIEKTYKEAGLSRELIVLKDNAVDFPWEGIYALELRHCKECVDINAERSIEETIKVITDSTIVNTFTFSVEFKKE